MASSKPPARRAANDDTPEVNLGKCSICSAPAVRAYRPFCSRRCADVDLSRWLRGAYAIPGRADVDEDGDDTAVAAGSPRDTARRELDEDDETAR
jgi:endogenous inhibitor of DNA gyrase (YacG/DUF329 family)